MLVSHLTRSTVTSPASILKRATRVTDLKPRERRFQTALEFAHHAIEAQQVFIRLLQLVDTLTYPLSRFKPQKLMR